MALPTTGLVGHYETDSGLTLNGSNQVTAWASQVNSRSVTQTGLPPTGTTPTGEISIQFGGGTDKLDAINVAMAELGDNDDPRSVVVVWRHVTDDATRHAIFEHGLQGTRRSFGVGADASGNVMACAWGDDLSSSVDSVAEGWMVTIVTYDGTTLRLYNGTTEIASGARAMDVDGSAAGHDFRMGVEIDNSHNITADLAAVILYDLALDTTARADADDFLRTKYIAAATGDEVDVDDTATLTDLLERALDANRGADDTATLTDTPATVTDAGRTVTDLVTLTDTVEVSIGWGRTVDDTASLGDTVMEVEDDAAQVTDTATLTDSVEVQVDAVRTADDSANLTDSAVAGEAGAEEDEVTDPATLTDEVEQVTAAVRAITDAAGLTDDVTISVGIGAEVTDTADLTDAIERLAATARTADDTAALTDTVMVELSGADETVATDPASLSDQVLVVQVTGRTADDTATLTDTVVVELGKTREPTDTVDLADEVTTTVQALREVTDGATLAEQIGQVANTVREIVDTAVLTDTVQVVLQASVLPASTGVRLGVISVARPVQVVSVERPVELVAVDGYEERDGMLNVESGTSERLRATIAVPADPTGTPPDWSVTTGARGDAGDWEAGQWTSSWDPVTGRVDLSSALLGAGQALDITEGVTYDLWLRVAYGDETPATKLLAFRAV